jgi:cell division protein FtsQ
MSKKIRLELKEILFLGLLLSLIGCFLLWLLDPRTGRITTVLIKGNLINTDHQTLQTMVSQVVRGSFLKSETEIFLKKKRQQNMTRILLNLPWIKDVQIHKRWPDTLIIQIQEHTIVAWWMKKALINNEGHFIMSYSAVRKLNPSVVQRLMKLPRFTGSLDNLNEILKRYNQLAPLVQAAGLHIQEFGCNARKTWYIRLNNKMTLKLGRRENKAQLQRFLKVYHLVMPSLKKMGHKLLMDLRYTNGIAVQTLLAK